MDNVLIIGATSAIAQAVARLYAERGATLYLLARNAERLEAAASDLKVRGAASVRSRCTELADPSVQDEVLETVWRETGTFDVVLIAYGMLSDQAMCEKDFSRVHEALRVNFASTVSWLTLLANRMEAQKKGTIAVLSSVAGDRGRRSNYVYGSAKAGLDAFLSGLRARLHRAGVHVLTVKPGFVDTPMTAHLKKSFLFASPEGVAPKILRGILKKKNVIYVPGFWRPILWVLRSLPESVFKRIPV